MREQVAAKIVKRIPEIHLRGYNTVEHIRSRLAEDAGDRADDALRSLMNLLAGALRRPGERLE